VRLAARHESQGRLQSDKQAADDPAALRKLVVQLRKRMQRPGTPRSDEDVAQEQGVTYEDSAAYAIQMPQLVASICDLASPVRMTTNFRECVIIRSLEMTWLSHRREDQDFRQND
jgi:hypothetical protein